MRLPHIYLYINDHGLSVWQGAAAHLACSDSFEVSAPEQHRFHDWAKAQVASQWHIVVDLQEEDYHIENVPHVSVRDRANVLGRKQEQLYRNTQYRNATLIGREAEGRRDDKILFSALSNPLPLEFWLNGLLDQEIRLVGIYSIALLTARHIKAIPQVARNCLVISRQGLTGLRQSYVSDGTLRFSRLIELEVEGSGYLGARLAAEAMRARQYLASMRAIERNEILQVALFCGDEEAQILRAMCPDNDQFHYRFIPLADLARALHVGSDGGALSCEPIWIRDVARNHPANQYATHEQRKPYLAWQISRALFALAGLLILASLAIAGHFWQSITVLDQEEVLLGQRRAQAEQVYQDNVPDIKAGEQTPSGMRNVVESYQRMSERWPMPAKEMHTLGNVLDRYPMCQLDELSWLLSPDANAATDKLEGPAQIAVPDQTAPNAGQRYVITQLKAKLPGYGLRMREALALIDAIIAAFAQEGYQVEKKSMPIDLRPEGKLVIGDSASQQGDDAPFELRLSRVLAADSGDAQ